MVVKSDLAEGATDMVDLEEQVKEAEVAVEEEVLEDGEVVVEEVGVVEDVYEAEVVEDVGGP